VTEIFAKCSDGALVVGSDMSWINMKVLAELQSYKTRLEGDVAEFVIEAGELWEALPDGLSFEYDSIEDSKAVPPCSFWPALAGEWSPGGYSKPGTTVIGDLCGYCGSSGGPVQREMPTGGAVCASAWCTVCGWPADSDASYLFVTIAKPFVPLARILEALSVYEGLLHLVIAAVTALLARLKSSALRCEIATCQREFFTHHGAHPPENPTQYCLGSFLGWVFQPQVA
jgi:hypothetical protein